jgi:hypothetical protein
MSEPKTVREILAETKETILNTKPQPILMRSARIFGLIVQILGAITFGLLTAGLLTLLWLWLFTDAHIDWIPQELRDWRYLLLIVGYLAVASPMFLITRTFGRLADNKKQTRTGIIVENTVAALWGIAAVAATLFILAQWHSLANIF